MNRVYYNSLLNVLNFQNCDSKNIRQFFNKIDMKPLMVQQSDGGDAGTYDEDATFGE